MIFTGKLTQFATRQFTSAAIILAATSSSVHAAQDGLNFGVNISQNTSNSCLIQVTQGGEMGVNGAGTEMNSKIGTGSPAKARVLSRFGVSLQLDTVSFFTTAPPGGNLNTTFEPTYSGTSLGGAGATFAEQPGSQPVQLSQQLGLTEVTAHLKATRPDGFPSGAYTALTILRCEP